MQAVGIEDRSLWLGSFVQLMRGECSLTGEELDRVLDRIWQNRLCGSLLSSKVLIGVNEREWALFAVQKECKRLHGVTEPAFRTSLLATAYMKALADDTNTLLDETEKNEYRQRIIPEALRACSATNFLRVPALKCWLERYCFASHQLDLAAMLEKLYAGYPEEKVTELKQGAQSLALELSRGYQNGTITKEDLKQLIQKIQAKIRSGQDVELSNPECQKFFDVYAENASTEFSNREKFYWRTRVARLQDFLKMQH